MCYLYRRTRLLNERIRVNFLQLLTVINVPTSSFSPVMGRCYVWVLQEENHARAEMERQKQEQRLRERNRRQREIAEERRMRELKKKVTGDG